MKNIIRKLHLILGLSSGLIVFIISITGCIYAFQYEITELTQPWRETSPQNQNYLLPSVIKDIADRELPGKHAHSVLYGKEHRSAQVIYFDGGENPYYYIVYIDQYTGKVLKTADMDADFFRIILMGHYYLWLPPSIGQPVAASATLIFVILMITGLILWWPKNKSARKQRFTIKWSAKWRRRNYDLHYVLGFYMTWVGIFIALTGLVWGFEWFAESFYSIASGGAKSYTPFYEAVSDTSAARSTDSAAVDQIWMRHKHRLKYAQTVEVHFPDQRLSAIGVNVNPDADKFLRTDYSYYDQYTLKEIQVTHLYARYNQNTSAADKVLRMNYDLHTGAIAGLPGKTIAFFASLICASLPVTGFMIWWGRKKKRTLATTN